LADLQRRDRTASIRQALANSTILLGSGTVAAAVSPKNGVVPLPIAPPLELASVAAPVVRLIV
jgi:hypothetical protein